MLYTVALFSALRLFNTSDMKNIILLFSLSFLLFACTATVESENNRWKANQETLAKFKTTYGSAAEYLNEDLEQATKAWNNAESISIEDDKIEALSHANDILSQGLSGKLKRMESALNDLVSAKKTMQSYGIPVVRKHITSWDYFADSDYAIQQKAEIEEIGFQANSRSELEAIVKSITDKAIAGTKAHKDIIEKIEVEKKDSEAIEPANNANDEQIGVAMTNCEYCGTEFEISTATCPSCGAALAIAGTENEKKDVSTSYSLTLKSAGNQKLKVVKTVKELTGKSLQESKELVEKTPILLMQNLSAKACANAQVELEKSGAVVEVKH